MIKILFYYITTVILFNEQNNSARKFYYRTQTQAQLVATKSPKTKQANTPLALQIAAVTNKAVIRVLRPELGHHRAKTNNVDFP